KLIDGSSSLWCEEESGHAQGTSLLRRATNPDALRGLRRARALAGRAAALHAAVRIGSTDRPRFPRIRRSRTSLGAAVGGTMARQADGRATPAADAIGAPDWPGSERLERGPCRRTVAHVDWPLMQACSQSEWRCRHEPAPGFQ